MRNWKTIITAGLVATLGITSCKKDDDQPGSSCDETVVIDGTLYNEAPDDAVNISEVSIAGDCLSVTFGASGCDGETWEIQLIDSEGVMESMPVQRSLRLSLKNEEECDAYFTRTVSFDISSLQIEAYNHIILNISNSDYSISYEY